MEYDFHKNHKLTLHQNMYISKGLTGLLNTSNKCYINSIIQCLSNTLFLTDYFLSNNYKNDLSRDKKITTMYINILYNIWNENRILKLRNFLENKMLEDKYSNRSNTHEDSHEFLLYLLNILHNGLKYEIKVDINGTVKSESDKLMKDYMLKWKELFEKDYSIIIKCFYGMTFSKIKCNTNCISNVYENFNIISLPITIEDSHIYECLDRYFFKNERIDNWKCDKCKTIGCTKTTSIFTLPNYLIIHLKRANQDNKLENTITFPLDELDLTKYIEESKQDKNNYIYSLYAVNNHIGNINDGHYWSYCKNLDKSWYCFDDENVSKLHRGFDSEIVTKNAYILFYYRKFISP